MGKGLKGRVFSDEEQTAPRAVPARAAAAPEILAPEFEVSRLHNGQLEFQTLLRVIVDKELQQRLWPRLAEDHFVSDASRAIFKRLQVLSFTGREWPGLSAFAMDPALPPSAQQQLRMAVARAERGLTIGHGEVDLGNGQKVAAQTSADFEGFVYDLLEAYRITRKATEHITDVVREIADDATFDPLTGPERVERVATSILSLRGRESINDALIHFGHQTTTDDDKRRDAEIRKLFSGKKLRFKTGFGVYDAKAGGLQPGEVALLGAGTGSGKTAMQLTMMTNMARLGTSTAMLQLELTKEQVFERLGANLANIDSELVRTGQLDEKQRERIQNALDEFHEECRQTNTRMSVYAPSVSTVQDCEFVFKTFPYRVWFIDYVNLLKLANDGDGKRSGEDWTRLSDIVKEFKRLAKKYRVAIVLAVQVNIDKESGDIEIRYAKAMKEHADVVLVWNLTKEAREEGVVWVRHLKARQYEPFDFPVRVALHHCRFESFSMADMQLREERKLGGKKKIKKGQDQTAVFKTKPKQLPATTDTQQEKVPVAEPLIELDAVVERRQTGDPILVEDEESYSEYDS